MFTSATEPACGVEQGDMEEEVFDPLSISRISRPDVETSRNCVDELGGGDEGRNGGRQQGPVTSGSSSSQKKKAGVKLTKFKQFFFKILFFFAFLHGRWHIT